MMEVEIVGDSRVVFAVVMEVEIVVTVEWYSL